MTEQYRMVGAWSQSFDQAKVAPRATLRDSHSAQEIITREVRRTTEGHQPPAARNRAHREEVELHIQMAGARDVAGAAGHRRRIDHDEIEFAKIFVPFGREILERVFMDQRAA